MDGVRLSPSDLTLTIFEASLFAFFNSQNVHVDKAVKAAAAAKELDKGAAAEAKGPLEPHWEEVLEAEGCFGAAAPGDAEAAGEPDELEELEDEGEEGGLDGDAEELLKMAFKPWVPDAD